MQDKPQHFFQEARSFKPEKIPIGGINFSLKIQAKIEHHSFNA